MELSSRQLIFILVGLAILSFFPFLGGVHLFDWDEINFAEAAREMLITGNWSQVQINFQPFYEKPPLFFWMQAFSMKLFGVGDYAARFPNAVCGLLTLVILFLIGKRIRGKRFGLYWALAYFGSILPHLYFKSGIIDPWFNLFIFLSLYFFIRATEYRTYLIYASLFAGLAILTKGPVGVLIPALASLCYLFFRKSGWRQRIGHGFIVLFGASLVAGVWFGYEWIVHGPDFIQAFIEYQIRLLILPGAGHAGFPGYHFVVLLIGCFPASIFAIAQLFRKNSTHSESADFTLWMKILFWTVLILFTLVRSKIVHYSSLAYFPLTYLAALSIFQTIQHQKLRSWISSGILVLGALLALALLAAPIVGNNGALLADLTAGNRSAQAVVQDGFGFRWYAFLPGIILLVTLAVFKYCNTQRLFNRAFAVLFIGSAIFIQMGLLGFLGNLEHKVQGPAIRFYQSLAEQDVYIAPLGYKSYAHYYYARVRDPGMRGRDLNWLFKGDIDKPAYFVTKVTKVDNYLSNASLRELYREGEFVFLERTPGR